MQSHLENGKNQNCFDPVAVSHIMRAYKRVLSEAYHTMNALTSEHQEDKNGFLVLITCEIVNRARTKFETGFVGGKSKFDDTAAKDFKKTVLTAVSIVR